MVSKLLKQYLPQPLLTVTGLSTVVNESLRLQIKSPELYKSFEKYRYYTLSVDISYLMRGKKMVWAITTK